MSEKLWCDIQWAKATARRVIQKITFAGAAKLFSKMNSEQRKMFLSKAFRAYKILKRTKIGKFDLSKILNLFEEIIKNIQTGKYDFLKKFVNTEDNQPEEHVEESTKEPTVKVKTKTKSKNSSKKKGK